MITILLFLVLIRMMFWAYEDVRSLSGRIMTAGVFLGLAGMLNFFGSELLTLNTDRAVARQPCQQEIVSIRDGASVSGSFRMLQSHDSYFMFGKTARGNLERVELRAYNCEIIQTDKESPKIKWDVVTFRPSKWYFIWPNKSYQRNSKYDIIVPPNTVIEQFRLQ